MKLVDHYRTVPPFVVKRPAAHRAPFVFNAPHSGTVYLRSLVQHSRLDRQTLRRSEDTFVDLLFDRVDAFGAPLLKANFPRVYLDLNRAPNELDAAMFDGPLPMSVAQDSTRVSGGLGVIAKVVGEQQEIYSGLLSPDEAVHRLTHYYHPYHELLRSLVEETLDAMAVCILVDCHSMPSGAVRAQGDGSGRPDVILGDRFGTSCAPELTDLFAAELRREGFRVAFNRPYAGGFITEHYGRPPLVHTLQLEINRSLYMHEGTYTRRRDFGAVRASFENVCERVMRALPERRHTDDWPLAAE